MAYEPPLAPIAFSIDTDGEVALTVQGKLVTPLGRFEFGSGAARDVHSGRQLPPRPKDDTRLIICVPKSGDVGCTVYQINSGRKLQVEMDGKFTAVVEQGQIKVDAAPGSTLVVKDVGPKPAPGTDQRVRFDVEALAFSDRSDEVDADLERGTVGTQRDLSYDHGNGVLRAINGAKVSLVEKRRAVVEWVRLGLPKSRVPALDLPSEKECGNSIGSAGTVALDEEDLDADVVLACVYTAEGRTGYLVIGGDHAVNPVPYYLYSYVWLH